MAKAYLRIPKLRCTCEGVRRWDRPITAANAYEQPKVARPRVGVYLTVEQVEAIVLNVHDDYLGQADRTIVLTAALTGLRQGELIALR